MKSTKSTSTTLKTIATHSLAVAIFVNPYVLLTLTDIYNIVLNNTGAVPGFSSLTTVMGIVSLAAFVIAVLSFLGFKLQSKK